VFGAQISYRAALHTRPIRDLGYRTTTRVLKCTAQHVLALRAEARVPASTSPAALVVDRPGNRAALISPSGDHQPDRFTGKV
jgi:hypothetical protein